MSGAWTTATAVIVKCLRYNTSIYYVFKKHTAAKEEKMFFLQEKYINVTFIFIAVFT